MQDTFSWLLNLEREKEREGFGFWGGITWVVEERGKKKFTL